MSSNFVLCSSCVSAKSSWNGVRVMEIDMEWARGLSGVLSMSLLDRLR